MKKSWQVIIVLCMVATVARAELFSGVIVDYWVDSMYQKLTIDERVGQLIDLRVNPQPDNIDALFDIIKNLHIGSITITGGNIGSCIELINRLQITLKVPIYVTIDHEHSLSFPFESAPQLPLISTYLQANDLNLLASTINVSAGIYHELGINSTLFSSNTIRFSENGLDFRTETDSIENGIFKDISLLYSQNNIVYNTDFHFDFLEDFAFSPRTLDSWNVTIWREKIKTVDDEWKRINYPQSVITIRTLPDFPENEAIYFNKKIVSPLFWKQLQYGGILSSDLDAIRKNHVNSQVEETIRSLIKIGSDKILISSNPEKVFAAIMEGLDNRYFRQIEIKEKVKRILGLKYMAGLSVPNTIDNSHAYTKLNDPELLMLSYQVYAKAMKTGEKGEKLLPFPNLESTNFASLVLGYSESKTFQETLEKYAPFVHYMLPYISFDPYDLNILSEQLVKFENVIIGVHTSGFSALDYSLLNFLKYLNANTNVVLVFLGKTIDLHEFDGFDNLIFVHEDNLLTQQIAAQQIFGALDNRQNIRRLSYSTPEMQEMDSKVLGKIDRIVQEAISMKATPGCQVLVARNGSVVMEKGYGYYTYDSIMPVDTRTMYDLASITKVVATSQAIMKLSEEGKINLDATLGDYLPELEGSNKASLIIKDILAHQSGLRAFYPFWRNTIEDEDQTLYYYKDKPNEQYNNTVAYGMFSAENLKDSLWNWTIETDLRKKSDKYTKYDYRYSDLGFYLLQVLIERVAQAPLDIYTDSLFYRSMGVSTLTFNPLCKYPLKRITPTEQDTEFRHVLVWGTVHDQIAAMKGGVSGHAGLFSNAHDIAKIMQMHLQGGYYGGKQYLQKETVEEFALQQHNSNRRGLGWDKPEKGDDYNPASQYASFDSFGHRGFTGTIAWADPTFNLVFVFLSNRIYPDAGNNKLIDFNIRKRIHDVVYESIWSFEKQYN